MMRRTSLALMGVFLMVGVTVWAGSPHFVEVTVSCEADSLTVSGKEAGLGNEEQVSIQVTADAECVNPGGNKPQAANKDDVAAAGEFPIQNGKANFLLTATAEFQPECSPPMTVEFSNILVTDLTHGVTRNVGDCP